MASVSGLLMRGASVSGLRTYAVASVSGLLMRGAFVSGLLVPCSPSVVYSSHRRGLLQRKPWNIHTFVSVFIGSTVICVLRGYLS